MSIFYFDYFSHIKLSKRVGQPFSGANSGTELLLMQIIESEYKDKCNIRVIYPNGFMPRDEYEERFLNSNILESIYVDTLEEVPFRKGDVLFIPLVCGRELIEVDQLKKKFRYLKIYGRIHDKNHNFPWDFMDRFYYSGFKRTGIPLTIDWVGKKLLFMLKYGKWVSNFDKIFTVSNYSMQVLKHKNIKFLNYYYQGILSYYNRDENQLSDLKDEDNQDFLLFINGGRPEKNCLRTILAFENYKQEHPSDKVKLYITSTKENERKNLINTLINHKEFNPSHIRFYDYLSPEELSNLYSKCKFLLFTSKGEGFGLPILEAMMAGKPVLASWSSSIPEVAGPSIRYVNPFDINSIKKGIEYYSIPSNLEFYRNSIKKRRAIVKQMIDEDASMLIRELFEDCN